MIKRFFILLLAIVASVGMSWAAGIPCTAADLGKVLCTDGSIYATVSDATAASKTAVAMIAYIDTENNKGLALALVEESGNINWSNAIAKCAAKTQTVTGGTWKLASEDEWTKIINAAGGRNALRDGFSAIGGSNLQSGGNDKYWSSTESSNTEKGRCISFNDTFGGWSDATKTATYPYYARACLAFNIGDPAPANSCGDGLTWELNNGELVISYDGEGTGVMNDYDIPHDNFAPWYANRENITSVSLPEGIKTIGEEAFRDCVNLTTVTIPNSVTTIGEGAFVSVEHLKTVTIGTGITSIVNGAFYGCTDLTTVTCSATTPPSIGQMVFGSCPNLEHIYVPAESVDAYKTAWSAYASLISAAGGGSTDVIPCTAADLGKVLCTDGSIYATVSEATAAGKTAAAVITYVDTENGKALALALADDGDEMNWETAKTTAAAHTPAVSGGTWTLASQDDWNNMITAAGSYTALRDGFSAVGGTNILEGGWYWSSTSFSYYAWCYQFNNGSWFDDYQDGNNHVRACLAFDIPAVPANKLYMEVDGTAGTLKWGLAGSNPVYDGDVIQYDNRKDITTLTIDESCQNHTLTSFYNLFYSFSGLTTINGLDNLATANVESMRYMFYNCKALTSLDLSSFNTANVTDMKGMFNTCSNLTTIYVGDGWNTSAVTDGNAMFYGCTNLPNYDSGATGVDKAYVGAGGYLSAKLTPANVMALINAIGTVEYTAECKAKIDAAREAYNGLVDEDKAQVTNLTTLTDAEAAYAQLLAQAVKAVKDQIDALPATPLTDATKKLSEYNKVLAAREAYDALSDEEKAAVANYDKLTAAEEAFAAIGGGGGSTPAGALNGAFTINADGDQILFSKGNLQATTTDLGANWTWGFAANQWNYLGIAVANSKINGNGTVSENGTVDLFGWSTAATYYGINNSYKAVDYSGDFVDWGPKMGAGWRTLTKDEWAYLLQHSSNGKATVNDKNGYIFLPDNWSGPAFTANPDNFTTNVYSGDDWTAMENAGAVFLPSGPARNGTYALIANDAKYCSSTSLNNDTSYVFTIYYNQSQSACTGTNRAYGCMVRLVSEGGGATPLDSAQAVKDLIEAIGEVSYPDSKEAIKAAREALDALSDEAKALFNEADTAALPAAEATYADLLAEKVAPVIDTINALPATPLTDATKKLSEYNKVTDARALYDALTDEEKAAVDNYDKLTAAEAAFAAIPSVGSETVITWDKNTGIGKISGTATSPAYEGITISINGGGFSPENDMLRFNIAGLGLSFEFANTLGGNFQKIVISSTNAMPSTPLAGMGEGWAASNGDKIATWTGDAATVKIWDGLTATSYWDVNTIQFTLGATVSATEAAQAVKDLIDAIGEVSYPDSKEAIKAAREALDALSDEAKALFNEADTAALPAAEATYADLLAEKVAPVIAAIDAIPSPIEDNLKLSAYDKVKAAREVYDALATDEEKAAVTNYDKLTAAEAAFAAIGGGEAGLNVSTEDIGKVLCADGSLYATKDEATAASKTPVAMIAYVKDSKGLAIALEDESDRKTWSTAITTAAAHTPAVTGGTWKLPSLLEWQQMFVGCGADLTPSETSGNVTDYIGLRDKLLAAGGNGFVEWSYWTTTEWADNPAEYAWDPYFSPELVKWYKDKKTRDDFYIRAILAFNVAAGASPLNEAQAVKDLIDAIPVPVSLADSCVNAIQAARAGYDALDDDAKAILDAADVKKLTDAEDAYAALIKEATDVIALINAIPQPVVYNEACGDSIAAARNAYDALSDELKPLVTNYPVLTDAEATYEALAPRIWTSGDCQVIYWPGDSTMIVSKLPGEGNGVMDNYANKNSVPWVDYQLKVKTLTIESGVTEIGSCAFYELRNLKGGLVIPEGVMAIHENGFRNCLYLTSITLPSTITLLGDNADAFNSCKATDVYITANPFNLTWNEDFDDFIYSYSQQDVHKTTVCHVPVDFYEIYVAKFDQTVNVSFVGDLPAALSPAEHAAIEAVKDSIAAIGAEISYPESGAAIDAARNGYDALDDDLKPFVSNYQTLLDAEDAYADAKQAHDAVAAAVVDKINAIPVPVEYSSKAAIDTARVAYDALLDTQKALVPDSILQKLIDAEAAWAAIAAKVEHNVSYIGKDGELKHETVALLHIPDPAPDFNGYEFVRWDVKAGDFLEEGLRIKAVYTPIITTNPVAYDSLMYNGTAQTLITAGVAKEGHIEYRLNDGEWSAELPKATMASANVVYYKLVREGHEDYLADSIVAIIAKAPVVYTAPTAYDTLVYNAANQTLIAAGQTQDGTFEYSLDPTLLDSWKTELPQAMAAGTYNVFYRVQGDLNHLDSTAVDPIAVTIAKAKLTATADDKEVVYGYAAPGFSVSYYGLKGSDLPADVLTGELSYTCDYTIGSNAGEYDITPGGQTSANYDITFVKGKLVVYKADPAFTAPTANTLTYNGGAQTLIAAGTTEHGTFEYTFIPNDEESWNTALPQAKNADTYGVYYRVVGDANHNDYESADAVVVTIVKAALTATAEDKTVTYGDAAPEYTAFYKGFMGEDTDTVVSGLAYTCEYAPTSNVGEYTITPNSATAQNYAISYTNGKLTVGKADLMITAEDKNVIYGDAAPTYTASYSGWKNDDDASVVDSLIFTCEYAVTSNIGEYAIVPSGAVAQNYQISYTNGKVTVSKAVLTITANDTVMIYGDAAPAFTASYSGWLNGDDESLVSGLAFTTPYQPGSPIGTYAIHPDSATAMNYAITFAEGKLTVNKAVVKVKGAQVHEAKFADGHAGAEVTDKGTLDGVKLNDPLNHVTTASFSSAEVSEHLTITLFYELTGDAALLNNYDLQPTSEIFTTEGVIIEPFHPDTTQRTPGEEQSAEDQTVVQEGIEVYAYGYCEGDSVGLKYHLNSGIPDQYKIDFADSILFKNVDWTNLDITGPDGVIYIDVPVNAPTGDYMMTVYFRDSRFDWLESQALTVSFHVNLPETFVKPLFDNTIVLVDTCDCFTDIQWYYRETSSDPWAPIPGATGHYYRPENGTKLTGEYFVSAKMNGVPTYTCGQSDVETLYGEGQKAPAAVVKAYPNPVVDRTKVSIENSTEWQHTLRIVNLMGIELLNTTFEGDETTVEMSTYQIGNYMISVDGITVKVMKK